MIAVILAAGMAKRLRPLTDNTPKCLLDVKGRSLLERSMDAIVVSGVRDFVIVTGYLNHMIEDFVKSHYGDSIRVTFIHNALYDSTNNIYSLWLAGQAVAGKEFLLLDSDLLYDPQIVKNVLASKAANVLTLIRHELGEEEMKVVVDSDMRITEISKTCRPEDALGESVGIEKMTAGYSEALGRELNQMIEQEGLIDIFYERAFERLIPQGHTFKVVDTTAFFSYELDTPEDFHRATELMPKELL